MGYGKAARQAGGEAFHHRLDLAANHTFNGTAHPCICQIGRAAGEDRFVRRLHVRMSADHRRDATIQITAHRDFFAGRFRMKIDKNDRRFLTYFGHLRIHGEEGIFDRGIHEGPAHGTDYCDLPLVRLHHKTSLARRTRREVDGSQQTRLCGHEIRDFMLIPAMIPQGDYGGSGAEEADAELGAEATSCRRIFTINNDKISSQTFF